MKTRIFTTLLALLTLTMQAQEIATWQGFRKGAASFTFDQGAPSHVSDAGPLFKKYGYKATFFLVYNWNPNWSGFQGLADEGHEIGSNSNSHPRIMTGEEASSKNNIAGKIKQKYGVITVAYPNCNVPDETAVLQNYVAGRICNGSWQGMDDMMGTDGPDTWSIVPALMTGSEGQLKSTSDFTGKMQAAIQKNGWVAFLTHGFQGKQNGNASYSPTDINAIDGALKWAQQNDKDIWIAPLGFVAMYIKERNASTFELKGIDTHSRTYSLTHNIADNVSPYDYPLSLRVPLPGGWSDVEVRQAGAKLEHKVDGGYVYFDAVPNAGDIVVEGVFPLVELQDSGDDNISTLQANNNLVCHVKINGRTIYRDGRWNTICLPFNLEDSDDSDGKNCTGTLFEGAIVKRFDSSSYTPKTKTLTLNFEDSESIWTGGPYLVRWDSSENLEDLVNPVFKNVEIIDGEPLPDTSDCIDFLGCYSPVSLAAQDRTVLYLGGDSKLYYPTDDVTVNAFRSYFQLKNGLTAGDLPTNGAKNFVLNFGDSTTEIGASLNDNGQWINDNFYSIDGRKLQGEPTQKGVYIQNGKKIVK